MPNPRLPIVLVSVAMLGSCAAGCAHRQPLSAAAVGAGPSPPPAIAGGSKADGNPDAAIRAEVRKLTEFLARSPEDTPARFQLANLYLTAHEPQKALTELRLLERRHADAPELWLLQGIALRVAGRPTEAARAARRLLRLRPGEEAALVLLGDVSLDQQRSEEALAHFNRCLERHPKSYGALVGKAQAQEQLFQSYFPISVRELLRPLEEAVRLEPDNPEGVILLARMTFAYRNQLDAAEQLALRATKLDPRNAAPYGLLAGIALARPATPEMLRTAARYATEASLRNAVDPAPHYYLGRVYLQQNEPARAAESLEKSIAIRPLPEAVSELAVAYRRVGNWKRADQYAAIYGRYMELDGRRKVLLSRLSSAKGEEELTHRYALVQLYLEAGQPEDAEAWLNEARKVRSHDPRAGDMRTRILRLRNGRREVATVLRIP